MAGNNESQYYQPGMYQSIENAYLARAKHKKAHKAKAKSTPKKPTMGHLHAPKHGDHLGHQADPYKKAAKHAHIAHAAKGKG